VPCSMESGTYPLSFSLADTIQTRSGPITIPFGEVLKDNVNVGTPTLTVGSSEMKMGLKAPVPSTTFAGISTGYTPRQFTTTIPGAVVNRSAIAPISSAMAGYHAGTSRGFVNATVIRNFNSMTGLLWTGLIPAQ